MSKSSIRDLPDEIKPFWKVFETLTRKHYAVTVFDDYLSMMVNYFTPPTQEGFGIQLFEKYSTEERQILSQLLNLTIQTCNEEFHKREWYDFFGDLYQFLAGKYKQSRLGQFFTPETIVDLNIHMLGNKEDLIGKGIKMNDPACGSGRFPIAFHAHFPGNYVYAEDIDLICCKMACINMMLHGCEGEVIHHNSLDPEDFQHGWAINHNIRQSRLPSIQAIQKEQSYVWQSWQYKKAKAHTENRTFQKPQAQQMSLFPL